MADAIPVIKLPPMPEGKGEEVVAVTCPICGHRSYRKENEGCPNGCKKADKKPKESKVEATDPV